jgi:hypothetical protein
MGNRERGGCVAPTRLSVSSWRPSGGRAQYDASG